jgi:hypothetical protein
MFSLYLYANRQARAGISNPRPGKSVDIDFLAAAGLRREYKPRLRSS